MHKNEAITISIANALNGLKILLTTENNAKIHLLATIIVVILAAILQLSLINWLFLLLAIFLVWITEAINTSLEYLFDLIQPDLDPKVKIGKDISAGAVLLSSIFSVIIGITILGPPIISGLITVFTK